MKLARSLIMTAGLVAMLASALPASAATHSHTKMMRTGDGSIVNGSVSKLTRHDDALSMKVKTRELEPGAAYTVWWVVFNHPENCIDGCDGDDVGSPAVDGTILWAAGGVVGNSGVEKFYGYLPENTPPTVDVRRGSGILTNAGGAEIHLVVRSHGPAIPGLVEEQITTFGGGCDINVCVNEQFTIHAP